MPRTRLALPSLYGGVSRQAPALRHANQVTEADNALLTIRDGLSKRPGSLMGWAVPDLIGIVYSSDLCAGGTPFTTVEYTGYESSKAFDDDALTTRWASNETGAAVNGASYIGYHFTTAKDITKIRFKTYSIESRNVSSVKIQKSTNGTDWTLVTTESVATTVDTWIEIEFSASGSAAYWRLLANSAIGDTFHWSMWEIEMMETSSISSPDDLRFHIIDRDETEQYLVVYGVVGTDMTVKPFDLSGNESTVNVSAGAQTYLNLQSAVSGQLRLATVSDYTLIANSLVALGALASDPFSVTNVYDDYDSMIADSPTMYTFHQTTDGDEVHTAGYWKYTDEVGGSTGSDILTGGSITCNHAHTTGQPIANAVDNNTATFYQATTGVTLPCIVTYDRDAGNEAIAGRLRIWYGTSSTTKQPISFKVQASNDNFSTTFDLLTVADYAPVINTWGAWNFTNGTAYRYYRLNITKLEGGVINRTLLYEMELLPFPDALLWQRVPPPNQEYALLDEDTMPVRMVRTVVGPPATFDISVIPNGITAENVRWGFRETGDQYSNPVPSLWKEGSTLSDLCVFRNRLFLGGGTNFVASQAGNLFSFYQFDFANLTDSDPIDEPLGGESVCIIDYFCPWNKTLTIFTKSGRQFELATPETLTPTSAAATKTTSHNSTGVRPADMGGNLYFASESEGVSRVMEYYAASDTISAAKDISAHAAGYLPDGIRSIRAALNADAVFILPENGNEIYVWRSYWLEDQRVQSAWERYTFGEDEIIHDIAILNNVCWMLIKNADGFFIGYFPVINEDETGLYEYPIRLDNRVEKTGSFGGGVTTWTLTVPDDSLTHAVLGPDFGTAKGTQIALTKVSSTSYRATGNYSAGEVMLGRSIPFSVTLTRPYVRDQNGAAQLSPPVSVLRELILNHTVAGGYSVVVSVPGQSDRLYIFTPPGNALTQEEGNFRVFVSALAGEGNLVKIESTDARPFALSGGEWFVETSISSIPQ